MLVFYNDVAFAYTHWLPDFVGFLLADDDDDDDDDI